MFFLRTNQDANISENLNLSKNRWDSSCCNVLLQIKIYC